MTFKGVEWGVFVWEEWYREGGRGRREAMRGEMSYSGERWVGKRIGEKDGSARWSGG